MRLILQLTLSYLLKTPIKLNQAEKVIITFGAEEDILTIDRLQEKTKWKPAYINRTLKTLEDKGFVELKKRKHGV